MTEHLHGKGKRDRETRPATRGADGETKGPSMGTTRGGQQGVVASNFPQSLRRCFRAIGRGVYSLYP
jgi:hypothetical protein